MNAGQRNGMIIGAAFGFMAVLAVLTLDVRSPWLLYSLWPANVIQNATLGMGELWRLSFRMLSFFVNIAAYGLLGLALGSLLPYAEAEKEDA